MKHNTVSPSPDRNGDSTENGNVDRSASRAGHAGQTVDALSRQIETGAKANFVDGLTSPAEREGEQVSAPFHSQSSLPSPSTEAA